MTLSSSLSRNRLQAGRGGCEQARATVTVYERLRLFMSRKSSQDQPAGSM